MRRRAGLVSGCLGTALLVIGSAVSGADDPKPREPAEVVMKSLDTKLLVDGRVIDTRGEFLRYRVEQVKGDWLWLVADRGLGVGPNVRTWCQLTRRSPTSARPSRVSLDRRGPTASRIGLL